MKYFNRRNKRDSLNNYVFQIYRRYSWGAEEKPELFNEANRFITQATAEGLYKEVEEAVAQGRKAYHLIKQLQTLLDVHDVEAAEAWIDEQTDSLDRRVLKSLEIYLDKWQKRQEQLKSRRDKRIYHSKLTPIVFDEYHPKSLRNLKPDSDWVIYIDESGQSFEQSTTDDNMPAHQLGRIVALAVPKRTQLQPIIGGFHATEASSEETDKALEYLLTKDVGIFGFTVSDPGAFAGNWFSHVVLLARWVLLQLPINHSESCRVSFVIERNDARLAYQPIDSLANLLEGEMMAIDAGHFKQLQITTELMDKKHPLNAYVDVLAFTWGSQSSASKDRLKKSALLGHCFLRPDQKSMERLYLSIARDRNLLPADWYELCTAVSQEDNHGLLAHYLKRLGDEAQKDFNLWQNYLDEVRHRMRYKDFRLSEVANALDWLENFVPQGQKLPAIYRLPLETSRLGQENHSGHVNLQRLQTCIGLINQLEEEDAQQACGALLRILVSASNIFQFDTLEFLLDEWLAKPIAVSGLTNYARLHSSRGQIHAFCHRPQEAIRHFEQALILFDRLSDQRRANIEKLQTNSYRLICLMDADILPVEDLLIELACSNDTRGYSRRIASSDHKSRYAQHLWLRALVSYPESSTGEREAYLMHPHQWQYGEDHPWGLIYAYRAWLLLIEKQVEKATELMSEAILLCADEKNGPVLWWMAEVLRTLAFAIGLTQVEKATKENRNRLKDLLPDAPHKALSAFAGKGTIKSHNEILNYLKQCLPFNFH